jgi:predicted nucleotidyltransferase
MVRLPPPLDQIRPRLEREFGSRLHDVILYGSRARDDHRPDSDVDVMVVLDGPFRLHLDLERTVEALYPLQLESDLLIHAMPVPRADFDAQEFAIYRDVQREGQRL